MADGTSTPRNLYKFLLVLTVLSLPFWVLGSVAEHMADYPLINLPISALMAVCPIIAALLLVTRESGAQGARALVKRTFAYNSIRSKAWYLPSLFIMPGVMLLSYAVMKGLNRPVPAPEISPVAVLVFLFVFFAAAIAEEAGWTGYLYDPLLAKWGPLATGLVIGGVWGLWHVIPYIQADNTSVWIAWQIVASVFNRMIMVWIYCKSGQNVLTGIIYHMMINVSVFLFPVYGSFYDPAITGCILGVLVICVRFLDKNIRNYSLS